MRMRHRLRRKMRLFGVSWTTDDIYMKVGSDGSHPVVAVG
jgi:hypothetical protein